jgi:hypothetical protein
MKKSRKAVFLILGLALPGAGARASEPAASVPWERIDAGLAQLAAGDGKAAEASFESARSADPSGLAGLLGELTAAYVADDPRTGPEGTANPHQDGDLLDAAHRHFRQRPVPPAVLGDALARIRRLLKPSPTGGPSPLFLRPLLCNLRLLSGDHATDGEPVLEINGKSGDSVLLIRPRPQFTPSRQLTAAAKQLRTGDTLAIDVELVLDSEGCPASVKLLKPPHDLLVDQTLASLSWWAYEPARYDGFAVGWRLPINLNVRFTGVP